MGCDIHCRAERRNSTGQWEYIDLAPPPLDDRNYRIFAFLADVRNYYAIAPITEPRGFPSDASPDVVAYYADWEDDAHTPGWLTVDELAKFNYDVPIEDRRVIRQLAPNWFSGACTCRPGEGRMTTLREFLGAYYFRELAHLQAEGAERIVFWFDN